MKVITKKLNKANQYVIQKIGSVKGTELDEDFVKMEKSCQIFGNMINEVTDRMENCLRITSSSGHLSLLSGRKSSKYATSQSDLLLSETCGKYANELSNCPNYSSALSSFADALKLQSSYKEQMDETIIQVFLEPIHQFHSNELKEINYLNKKMMSRRLDFDSNKRKCKNNGVPSSDELVEAQDKFESTRDSCSVAMASFLSNDLEKINQLKECSTAFAEYFSKSLDNFNDLLESLKQITQRAITDQQSMSSVNNYSEDAEYYNDNPPQTFVPSFNYATNSEPTYQCDVPPSHFDATSYQSNLGTTTYQCDVPPSHFDATSYLSNLGTTTYQCDVPPSHFDATSYQSNIGTTTYQCDVPSSHFNATSYLSNLGTTTYQCDVPPSHFDATSYLSNLGTTTYQDDVPTSNAEKDETMTYQTNVSYNNFEVGDKPWARALYNFEAEQDDEISFSTGNRIDLISRLDQNWMYGSVGGKTGYFPINYVEVVVPLDY